MAINKPEQASTEMTKVLKSIADTIDGKPNTDCAATSEISKWTKYVGNKLAENSSSGGGSGVEVVKLELRYNSEATSLYFTKDKLYISESEFLSLVSDENKLVLVDLEGCISVMINKFSYIISLYPDSNYLTMQKISYSRQNSWIKYNTKISISSSATSTYTKTNLSYAEAQV